MKQAVIYKIINTTNGKFYVGSSTNFKERSRCHKSRLRSGKHHSKHLQAAWNTYGEDAFIFKTIAIIPDGESLQAAEDMWLIEWVGKPECYNTSLYSDSPMRGIAKELHPMFGKPRTDATKHLIREARLKQADPRLGAKHSEETKQLIREKKLASPTRAWLGKTRSAETKAKISTAQLGVKKAPRVYTPEGLAKVQANMKRNAATPEVKPIKDVIAKFPQEVQKHYDFSKAVYTGALNRITSISCPLHGEFSQYAAQLRKGSGCPSCGAVQRAASKSIQMKAAWGTPEDRAMMLLARKKRV